MSNAISEVSWPIPGCNPAWGAFTSEEPTMTMQIAMIGTDGIVLASDTKQTRTPFTENAAKRYGFGSSKIGISEDRRIAATCAMDMKYAAQVACAVFADLGNDIHPLEICSDHTEKIKESADIALDGLDVQCIFAFADPEPALYRFTSLSRGAQEKEIKCQKILDRIPAGDITNAASIITSKPAIRYQFKTGQRDWPKT
jgi:hypothetical protein